MISEELDRFIPTAELLQLIPMDRVTIWRRVRDNKFPVPVRLANRNFWLRSEISAWMKQQASERKAA
jgi:predicted DNA-binding transcriptional regulator AlpA